MSMGDVQRTRGAVAAGMVLALAVCAGLCSGAVRKERGEPGVMVRFERGGRTDSRVDRLVALFVRSGERASSFLPPGPFRATFKADLQLRLRDQITFGVAGRGAVKVLVNGEVALERAIDSSAVVLGKVMKLSKGKNRIVLEYASPETGDAWVRLYWSSPEFAPEPVPPMVLSHVADENLAAATQLREGRDFVLAMRCLNCHSDSAEPLPDPWADGPTPLTHPARNTSTEGGDAPSLENIGGRLRREWLVCWINNPRALRESATMPRVFRGGKGGGIDPQAVDVAAYLASLGGGGVEEEQEINAEAVAAGGRLFAFLRCAGCHTRPDRAEAEDEHERVPLSYVRAKFRHGALVEYLKLPHKHYSSNPMPDFKLSQEEAGKLAAFLMAKSQKKLEMDGDVQGDAKRGSELVVSAGCLNCHSMGAGSTPTSTLKAAALQRIERSKREAGCLTGNEAGRSKGVDYSPDDRQRTAVLSLLDFAAKDGVWKHPAPSAEAAQREVNTLRCRACHVIDANDDTFSLIAEEVADLAAPDPNEVFSDDEQLAPDQSPPMLTWAGEKLKPEWVARFIEGQTKERLRPWLRARMPAFHGQGVLIASGLAAQHGFAAHGVKSPEPDPELAAAGKTLVGTAGGFACVACHGVGSAKAVGVFEAPGINLQYAEERLNKHFYDRWVINPMRVQPDSKMPTFAAPDGSSSIKEILGGDARKQYEAIHHYLRAGRRIEPPAN